MIPTRRNVIVPVALLLVVLGGVVIWLSWSSTRPVLAPIGPARVQPQIVFGGNTVIVLAPDGSLWGWGNNFFGTLTTNLPPRVPRPVRVGTEANWRKVAADSSVVAAIKADGTLWGWGSDRSGLAGRFERLSEDRDWRNVSVGRGRIITLKENGTLWAQDFGTGPQAASGAGRPAGEPIRLGTGSNWTAVAAGFYRWCGLQQDGSIWHMGQPNLADVPTRIGNDTNWVALENGIMFSLVRKRDGSWWVGGHAWLLDLPGVLVMNQPTQLVRLPQTDRWELVAAGGNHVLGLTRNGAMRALGLNHSGQLGDGTTNRCTKPIEVAAGRTWIAIGAGNGFSVALAADGSLWTWGWRLGESSERSRLIRTLGAWAKRLGLRAAWADPKPPRFDTKPRCILRFTTNAPAGPR